MDQNDDSTNQLNENSIEQAIQNAENQIEKSSKAARWILLIGISLSLFALGFGLLGAYGFRRILNSFGELVFQEATLISEDDLIRKNISPSAVARLENVMDESRNSMHALYLSIAVFFVVFGVFMAIYRFHLTEIAKFQQYKFGLLRIRVAARNFKRDGFRSEVREALTKDAFLYAANIKPGKQSKIENPLQGHASSDLAVLLLNKILDGLEVTTKQKENT